MNRAERRRQERAGVDKQSILQKYRQDAFNEGYDMGARGIVEITFYLTAYTLSYKTGFSKKRLRELMNSIYLNIDSFRTGQLVPQDYDTIVEEMNEKYGIKIS